MKSYLASAYGLNPSTSYSLICYPAEDWPNAIFIGSGTTNAFGNLAMRGELTITPTYKIWIVLSSDYDSVNDVFIGWHPSEYLFEGNII